jgi:hypothetical protein
MCQHGGVGTCRTAPTLSFLHAPPVFSDQASSTAQFVVVSSGTSAVTLFPMVTLAGTGEVVQVLPPTTRMLLQLGHLPPAVNYTLIVGCMDATGLRCASNATYTWGSVGCPVGAQDAVAGLRTQSIEPGVRAFVWTAVPHVGSYEYAMDGEDWQRVPPWPFGTPPLLMVRGALGGPRCHLHRR